MIFSSTGPRDGLSESIYRFLLDAVARNNNSTSNLEVNIKKINNNNNDNANDNVGYM